VGLVLLAFLIRLVHLEAQSIWWDEAITIHLATADLGELLADRATHVHPPLYFLLMKGWVALAGVSAFAVRFVSVWFNVLLVPVAYAFGCGWLDRRTGLVSAVLMALSPLYVVYSQEARVYALLPLLYAALLILSERLREQRAPQSWTSWALVSLVEVIGLYLHYAFLFAIAAVRLLLIIDLWRRQRGIDRWLVSLAADILAYLPWAVAVALNWQSVLGDVRSGDPFVRPVPLDHLARLLWTFQWSGLTGAPGYRPLRIAAFMLAGLLFLALVLVSRRAQNRAVVFRLLSTWLIPLSTSLLMWLVKPLSHPRYVVPFTVGLLLLCAYVMVQLARGSYVEKGLATLVALAILSCAVISLQAYAFDQAFAKDDVRAVAAWLEARTTERSLIVAPWRDWSLDYAYGGPAPIIRPNPAAGGAAWTTLMDQSAADDRVFVVGYPDRPQDHRGLIPFALETAGSLMTHRSFADLRVRVYRLDQGVTQPQLTPADARLGPLRLVGTWAEDDAPASTAIGASLGWRLEEPVAGPLRVSLSVQDASGWTWSTTDDWLLNEAALPTDHWPAGEEATTYHLLPLPPGTPPVTGTLSLSVYEMAGETIETLDVLDEAGNPRGQSLTLSTVSLSPAVRGEANPYGLEAQVPAWDEPVGLGDGITLVGASLDPPSIVPGGSLFVGLRWQSRQRIESPRTASLVLSQQGPLAVKDIVIGGRYPAPRWSVGQTVVEHRRLVVPGTAADGAADVILRVGGRRVTLGQVDVDAREHVFDPPPMVHQLNVEFDDVATLLGYDLMPGPYVANHPITVTLYWRALEGAARADYVVFTHLLDDEGRLVGQHDGRPVDGSRPSRSWIPGEILVDRHPMAWRTSYVGPATIEVGLYTSTDLVRVPIKAGGDAVLLPTSLTIVEP
jgi:hypothetical protein